MGLKKMIYQQGKELWRYEPGTVIQGVPISYFNGDKDAMEYIGKRAGLRWWREQIDKFKAEFDPNKLEPLFYCNKCQRLEDGAHRLVVAKEKGIDKLDVRIGKLCYKKCKANDLISGEPAEFLAFFNKIMAKFPSIKPKDFDWLEACVMSKWSLFGNLIDFREKKVLDIGCHVGYSCIDAWCRGAKEVSGIDIRQELLLVGMNIREKLGIPMCSIMFFVDDWIDYKLPESCDIVLCMGLLHYFPKDIYEKMLEKLCFACGETLILELRIIDNGRLELIDVKGQTLPTIKWLEKVLAKNGFVSNKRFIRGKNRELWIARKEK